MRSYLSRQSLFLKQCGSLQKVYAGPAWDTPCRGELCALVPWSTLSISGLTLWSRGLWGTLRTPNYPLETCREPKNYQLGTLPKQSFASWVSLTLTSIVWPMAPLTFLRSPTAIKIIQPTPGKNQMPKGQNSAQVEPLSQQTRERQNSLLESSDMKGPDGVEEPLEKPCDATPVSLLHKEEINPWCQLFWRASLKCCFYLTPHPRFLTYQSQRSHLTETHKTGGPCRALPWCPPVRSEERQCRPWI